MNTSQNLTLSSSSSENNFELKGYKSSDNPKVVFVLVKVMDTHKIIVKDCPITFTTDRTFSVSIFLSNFVPLEPGTVINMDLSWEVVPSNIPYHKYHYVYFNIKSMSVDQDRTQVSGSGNNTVYYLYNPIKCTIFSKDSIFTEGSNKKRGRTSDIVQVRKKKTKEENQDDFSKKEESSTPNKESTQTIERLHYERDEQKRNLENLEKELEQKEKELKQKEKELEGNKRP